jgi:hypothetical protein
MAPQTQFPESQTLESKVGVLNAGSQIGGSRMLSREALVFSAADTLAIISPGRTRKGEGTRVAKETAQEYIHRILGHVEGQDALKVQSSTAKKIESLLKGKSAARLKKRPAPDKWSVVEILAHLADAEIAGAWRIRAILGAPGTPLQAFDQDTWVVAGHYEKRDARKSLDQFRALREANIALMKSLTPEQWKQHGMHAERGVETVEHIARMFAGHDINHLKQIERILAKKSK